MYAAALLRFPHSATGNPLNRMKPFPSISSLRSTPRNAPKVSRWNVDREMPVRGVPLARNVSAAREISSSSVEEKTCVQWEGWAVCQHSQTRPDQLIDR